MAVPTLHDSGTTTITGTAGSPQLLANADQPGTYVLEVSGVEMGSGDEIGFSERGDGGYQLNAATFTFAALVSVGGVKAGVRRGPLPIEVGSGSSGFYVWMAAGSLSGDLAWQLYRYL